MNKMKKLNIVIDFESQSLNVSVNLCGHRMCGGVE